MKSTLNERRHFGDLAFKDNDLLTVRDARLLCRQEFQAFEAAREQQREAAGAAFDSLPWWRRAWLKLKCHYVTRPKQAAVK